MTHSMPTRLPARLAAFTIVFALVCPLVGAAIYPVLAFGALGFAFYGKEFGALVLFVYATGVLPAVVVGLMIGRLVAAKPRPADHLFPAAALGGLAALAPLAFWLRDIVESGGSGTALIAATVSSVFAAPAAGLAASLVATLVAAPILRPRS